MLKHLKKQQRTLEIIFIDMAKLKYITALTLTLAVIMLSAFIKEKNLPGFYYSKDCLYNLTLLNDSTFQFKHRIGYRLNISTGTWHTYREKYLILRSKYLDVLNTPVNVSERKTQEDNDSISFNINSQFVEVEECHFVLILNDSIIIESSKRYFKSQRLNQIKKFKLLYACPDYKGIPYQIRDTVGTVVYNVEETTSNEFDTEWNCDYDLFYYVIFYNDTLDIKNNYLFFRNKNSKLFKGR